MPDHASQQRLAAHRAKLAAVHTEWVRAGDKKGLAAFQYLLNPFDQGTIGRHVKGNYLTGTWGCKKEGDFGNEHKIPFLVVRNQTVAMYF